MAKPLTVQILVEQVLVNKQISRDLAQQLNALITQTGLSEADWRAFDQLSDAVLEGQVEICR